jgi:hypothetical protein
MCKYCDDIKNIAFDSDLNESEKLAMINEETHKQIIMEQLENESIGVSFEELGLTLQDFEKAESFPIDNDDLKIGFSKEKFGSIINLYKYESEVYGSRGISSKSREFCVKLWERTQLAAMRYHDILRLNGSNPGFGAGGTNSYSIFLYRGGVNCRHVWVKYLYDEDEMKLIGKSPSQPRQPDRNKVGHA